MAFFCAKHLQTNPSIEPTSILLGVVLHQGSISVGWADSFWKQVPPFVSSVATATSQWTLQEEGLPRVSLNQCSRVLILRIIWSPLRQTALGQACRQFPGKCFICNDGHWGFIELLAVISFLHAPKNRKLPSRGCSGFFPDVDLWQQPCRLAVSESDMVMSLPAPPCPHGPTDEATCYQ